MKRNVFLLMMLAVVLAFSTAVIACDDGSGNGGNSGGNGGGGGSGSIPTDLHGTWKMDSSDERSTDISTMTITANSVVILQEEVYLSGDNSYGADDWSAEYTNGETYWNKMTFNVTSCTPVNNDAAATKELFPSGYRVALQVTKHELSSNYDPRLRPSTVGREAAYSFILNNPKNRISMNGRSNAIYDKQ